MTNFWDWLVTEAGAAWGITILTWLGIILRLCFSHYRPTLHRVVCREISHKPLLYVDPQIQDDLEILYCGKRVTSLSHVQFEICNLGSEPIDAVNLEIRANLIQSQIMADAGTRHPDLKLHESSGAIPRYLLTTPYLNQYRGGSKAKIWGSVIHDGGTHIEIVGGGRGWRLEHIQRVSPTAEAGRLIEYGTSTVAVSLIGFFAVATWGFQPLSNEGKTIALALLTLTAAGSLIVLALGVRQLFAVMRQYGL